MTARGWILGLMLVPMLGCDLSGLRARVFGPAPDDDTDVEETVSPEPASEPAVAPAPRHCEYPGIVSSEQALVITAPEAGIVRLRGRRGEHVGVGVAVAELDNPEIMGAAMVAEAGLQRARAERSVAERKVRGAQGAVREVERLGEYASGAERRRAEHDRGVLQAELRASAAMVRQHETTAQVASGRREGLVVAAPFESVVADVLVESGARVAQGDPLLRVVASGRRRLRFAVSEARAGAVQPAAALRWSTPDGRRQGEATVVVVAAEVDAHAGVLVVEAELPPTAESEPLPSGSAVVVMMPCEDAPLRGHSAGGERPEL